jgi:hypothetical protein
MTENKLVHTIHKVVLSDDTCKSIRKPQLTRITPREPHRRTLLSKETEASATVTENKTTIWSHLISVPNWAGDSRCQNQRQETHNHEKTKNHHRTHLNEKRQFLAQTNDNNNNKCVTTCQLNMPPLFTVPVTSHPTRTAIGTCRIIGIKYSVSSDQQ